MFCCANQGLALAVWFEFQLRPRAAPIRRLWPIGVHLRFAWSKPTSGLITGASIAFIRGEP